MKMGLLACAFGRHSVDYANMRKAGGYHVCKCRYCKTPMEEIEPHVWDVLRVKDAGLGPRHFS